MGETPPSRDSQVFSRARRRLEHRWLQSTLDITSHRFSLQDFTLQAPRVPTQGFPNAVSNAAILDASAKQCQSKKAECRMLSSVLMFSAGHEFAVLPIHEKRAATKTTSPDARNASGLVGGLLGLARGLSANSDERAAPAYSNAVAE